MAAPDDFSSLEGLERRTAVRGFSLLSAVWYIALGVLAIWIARKILK